MDTALTRIVKHNPGVDTLILKELVVEASDLFRNILEWANRDGSSIPQLQALAIKIMIHDTKLHTTIADFVYRPQRPEESLLDFISNIREAIDSTSNVFPNRIDLPSLNQPSINHPLGNNL